MKKSDRETWLLPWGAGSITRVGQKLTELIKEKGLKNDYKKQHHRRINGRSIRRSRNFKSNWQGHCRSIEQPWLSRSTYGIRSASCSRTAERKEGRCRIPALHGKYGEDGTIQSVLELAGIPYTGSGVSSSAITMDKIFSMRVMKQAGIPMADSMPVYSGWHRSYSRKTACSFQLPTGY